MPWLFPIRLRVIISRGGANANAGQHRSFGVRAPIQETRKQKPRQNNPNSKGSKDLVRMFPGQPKILQLLVATEPSPQVQLRVMTKPPKIVFLVQLGAGLVEPVPKFACCFCILWRSDLASYVISRRAESSR